MSYERVLDAAPPSDDCTGRAIWALGVAAELAQDDGCRVLARDMIMRALPHASSLGPRGTAQCVLGLVRLLKIDRTDALRTLLDTLVGKLTECYRANATPIGAGSSPRSPTTTRSCRLRCLRRTA
jgi:hypothetical protein